MAAPAPMPTTVDALFDALDKNGDGRLSREEFEAYQRSQVTAPTSMTYTAMPALINPKAAPAPMPTTADALFDALDRNGDGRLSREEFEAFQRSQVTAPRSMSYTAMPALNNPMVAAPTTSSYSSMPVASNYMAFPSMTKQQFGTIPQQSTNNVWTSVSGGYGGIWSREVLIAPPVLVNDQTTTIQQEEGGGGPNGNHYGAVNQSLKTQDVHPKILLDEADFPALLVWFLLCAFCVPISLMNDLARDASVQMWITTHLGYIKILPFLYLLGGAIQSSYRRMKRWIVLSSALGSCVLLVLLAQGIAYKAEALGTFLGSQDCDDGGQKMYIEGAWQAAWTFYGKCMENTAGQNGTSLAHVTGLYRIQMCTGYRAQLNLYPVWRYLQYVEESLHCGGWCYAADPLWSLTPVRASCSDAVSDFMTNRVAWSMTQVKIYSELILGLIAMLLVLAGPIIYRTRWRGDQFEKD